MIDFNAPFEAELLSPLMSAVYWKWRKQFLSGSGMPSVNIFDALPDKAKPHSFLAAVEPGGFRFEQVGPALEERLKRPLAGETVEPSGDAFFGTQTDAYRKCVASRTPAYEFMKSNLGDGRSILFERLLYPFFDASGAVTHLGGTVLFTET